MTLKTNLPQPLQAEAQSSQRKSTKTPTTSPLSQYSICPRAKNDGSPAVAAVGDLLGPQRYVNDFSKKVSINFLNCFSTTLIQGLLSKPAPNILVNYWQPNDWQSFSENQSSKPRLKIFLPVSNPLSHSKKGGRGYKDSESACPHLDTKVGNAPTTYFN